MVPKSAYDRVLESTVAGLLKPFTNVEGFLKQFSNVTGFLNPPVPGFLNPAGIQKSFTSVSGRP